MSTFFRNLTLYRLPRPWNIATATIEEALKARPFVPLDDQLMRRGGWVPSVAGSDEMTLRTLIPGDAEGGGVTRHVLITLCIEERMLPGSVIKRAAEARAVEIEKQQGFKPGRTQMRDISEAVALELRPRAFTKLHTIRAWLALDMGWLGIDTASTGAADDMLDALRSTLEGFPVKGLRTLQVPQRLMSTWLYSNQPDPSFTIDQDCELRATTDEKATVRYVRHALDGQDVHNHLSAGKLPTRLALTWDDRISFVLTDKMALRRLEFLDIIQSDARREAQALDASPEAIMLAELTLMAGELSRLIPDLVESLGGETYADDDAKEPAAERPPRITVEDKNLELDLEAEDPLFEDAVAVVMTAKRVSISLVQRHLRLGYNRAARLVERMEKDGMVSGLDGNGVRAILGGQG